MTNLVVDVTAVVVEIGASRDFSGAVEAERLVVGPEDFVYLQPVVCSLTLSNTGAGLVLSGTATTTVRAQCARCLEPFDMSLEGSVEGLYVREEDQEGLPEEQEYEVLTSSEVDLWPVVESALAVATPFAPLHDEACAGLCPTCGVDLNKEACCCEPERRDSPFSALSDFFDRDDAGGDTG
jgi:uncharacterized protein